MKSIIRFFKDRKVQKEKEKELENIKRLHKELEQDLDDVADEVEYNFSMIINTSDSDDKNEYRYWVSKYNESVAELDFLIKVVASHKDRVEKMEEN